MENPLNRLKALIHTPPEIPDWKRKTTILLTAIACLGLVYGEAMHSPFTLNFSQEWRYAINSSFHAERIGWLKKGYDDKNWNKTTLPFSQTGEPDMFYFRGTFKAPKTLQTSKIYLEADDCIKAVYINNNKAFEKNDCRGCEHCDGITIDTSPYLKNETNTIAIEVQNQGGPMKLVISAKRPFMEYMTWTLIIALLFVSYAGRDLLHKPWMAALIFMLVATLFSKEMLIDFDYTADGDWDQFLFTTALAQDSIIKHTQPPLWNPYFCGGTALLGYPEVTLTSPTYMLITPFNTVHGLKMLVIISMIVGMTGSFILARHMKMGVYSAYITALIYMGSGYFFEHIKEGHINRTAICWIPWIFLLYLKSRKNTGYAVLSAAVFSLMILEGNAYETAYTALMLGAYALIETALEYRNKPSIRPLTTVILILALTGAFSAVKILPVAEFGISHPRIKMDDAGYTWRILYNALLNASQGFRYMVQGMALKWHEYGSYVGLIPVALAAYGLMKGGKQRLPLAAVLFLFVVLSFNANSPINIWRMLQKIPYFPFFSYLGNAPRMVIIVVFMLSLLAGLGLTRMEEKDKTLAMLLLFLVFADLLIANGSLMKDTFTIAPPSPSGRGEFTQSLTGPFNQGRVSIMYDFYLLNKGTIDCYNAIPIAVNAKAKGDENYKGEAYLNNTNGTVQITAYTPNKITVHVKNKNKDTLVINQNHYTGWKTTEGEVKPYEGLVSVELKPGDREITLYYMPDSFIKGLIISAATIMAAAVFLILWHRENKTTPASEPVHQKA